MELKKYSEVYTLTDKLENGWAVNGNAVKEFEGQLRIDFSANKEEQHIGNYNYIVYENGHVHVNYNISGGQDEDAFVNYSEALVDEILKQINNELEA